MQIATGKMGVKGHLVMPQYIREMLKVDKGSTIAWVVTDDNRIEVKSVTIDTISESNEFELALATLGMSHDDWRASRKDFAQAYRANKLKKEQENEIAVIADA
ncbi:MAG: hypothetical protein KIH69_019325 [Anaerolineae bacterium]|nr:hypothetical protein [Anaerolineae bacterium]